MTTGLLTDLYQLTMAYGYWKNGMAEREAVFHLFYRRAPFGGNACVVAGTTPAIDYLTAIDFSPSDLRYLATLTGNDGQPLFAADFLSYLENLEWTLDVNIIAEGNLAFPNEPIMRVQGPLLQCQLVETALLNLVNFQTLVATKAARICEAAAGDTVLEFGLRRAQGPDGGLGASRAAYIGGCHATSNVLAGKEFGIPVKGTHAHSWVMSFDSELEAFDTYAAAMPNNVVLLVDTYDTLDGVRNAVKIARKLADTGHQLLGIRLDSGDLAQLSQDARRILDAAGLADVKVVASNDLDEYAIRSLKKNGARIDIWGIGTKLVTAYDQPALGGVYKLGAIRENTTAGKWQPRIKLSNDLIKVSNPGVLQISRHSDAQGNILEDIIYDQEHGLTQPPHIDQTDLLIPAIEKGKRVLAAEPISTTRSRAIKSWRSHCAAAQPPVSLDPYVEQSKRNLLSKNGFTS